MPYAQDDDQDADRDGTGRVGRGSPVRWRRPLLVSVAYVALWLGLDAAARLFQVRQGVSLWYPPTSLTVVLLLVVGLRCTPLVLVTDLVHGLLLSRAEAGWGVVVVHSLVMTAVYAGAVALLLRRARIDPRLPGRRDVAWFLGLAAVAAPLTVAVAEVVGYDAVGLLPWRDLVPDVLASWSGGATGVGVLAPVLLVASRRAPALWAGRPPLPVVADPAPEPLPSPSPHAADRWSWRRLTAWGTTWLTRRGGRPLELAGQVLALVAAVGLAYGKPSEGSLDLAYLVYLPMIWIAVRGGFPRVACAVLVANVLAVTLVGRDVVDRPLRLQLGLVTLTLASLALGALVTGRQADVVAAQHAAVHDPLTGLANRVLLVDRLTTASRRAQRTPGALYAVLYCDLDGFKGVNDQLGHDAGDQLLVAVARRLEQAVRPGDLVSRLGGDEMAVLLDGVADPDEAAGVAERLLAAVGEPYPIDGHEVVVTTSVGVAVAGVPRSGASGVEDVLRAADAALQRAKQRGGHRFEVFSDPLREQARDRLGLRAALRRAVASGAVRVAFQPIVGLPGGDLVAVEALARWTDPDRGDVPPSEFIPAAEETGLIHDLGMQVLERACEQVGRWWAAAGSAAGAAAGAAGGPASAPVLAVNVSTRQLLSADFPSRVLSALDRSGLPVTALELEVTESCAVEPGAREALQELAQAGIALVIDDFGTGYSSFAALRDRTPHGFKIDRSFVERLPGDGPTDAIVQAVLAMAGHLGVVVTAEGVETPAQLHRLRELGCPQVQGVLVGPPAGADEIERRWLPGASAGGRDQGAAG